MIAKYSVYSLTIKNLCAFSLHQTFHTAVKENIMRWCKLPTEHCLHVKTGKECWTYYDTNFLAILKSVRLLGIF